MIDDKEIRDLLGEAATIRYRYRETASVREKDNVRIRYAQIESELAELISTRSKESIVCTDRGRDTSNLAKCLYCGQLVSGAAHECPTCGLDPQGYSCYVCKKRIGQLSNLITSSDGSLWMHIDCLERLTVLKEERGLGSCPACHCRLDKDHLKVKGRFSECAVCGHPIGDTKCFFCGGPLIAKEGVSGAWYSSHSVCHAFAEVSRSGLHSSRSGCFTVSLLLLTFMPALAIIDSLKNTWYPGVITSTLGTILAEVLGI